MKEKTVKKSKYFKSSRKAKSKKTAKKTRSRSKSRSRSRSGSSVGSLGKQFKSMNVKGSKTTPEAYKVQVAEAMATDFPIVYNTNDGTYHYVVKQHLKGKPKYMEPGWSTRPIKSKRDIPKDFFLTATEPEWNAPKNYLMVIPAQFVTAAEGSEGRVYRPLYRKNSPTILVEDAWPYEEE